jgi:hypothetical protein
VAGAFSVPFTASEWQFLVESGPAAFASTSQETGYETGVSGALIFSIGGTQGALPFFR